MVFELFKIVNKVTNFYIRHPFFSHQMQADEVLQQALREGGPYKGETYQDRT